MRDMKASAGLETNPYKRLLLFTALITTDSKDMFVFAYKRLAGGYGGRGTWNYVNTPLDNGDGKDMERDREYSRRYYREHRQAVLERRRTARTAGR